MERTEALALDCPLPLITKSRPAGLLGQLVAEAVQEDNAQGQQLRPPLVEQAASSGGELIELLYRSRLGLSDQLDAEAFSRLITETIQASGCLSTAQVVDSRSVRIMTSKCAFGGRQDSPACHLVLSVVGSIAAHNFGYAKVDLRRSGGSGQPLCVYCVELDPRRAARQPGMEFRYEDSSPEVLTAPPNGVLLPLSGVSAGDEPQPTIVGCSQQMRRILGILETVAPTAATVLITGETGTGKECLARALHGLSDRARGEFQGINCGAIPENLIESALFGHERGAFTGAHARHIGYFERANGGTLFLDEVDGLSPEAQVRLLRVLQEGEYERVGGQQLLRNGARIVAATNTQLQKAIETGRLRSDLYYRLNVVNIHIPPLRERPEDLPVLIDHILSKLNQCYGHRVTSLGERAKRSLMHYHWPGNVRQLENVLERSYIFAAGSRLDTVLFDEDHLQVSSTANVAAATPQPSKETAPWKHRGKAALRAQERQALEVALAQHGGNVTQAAAAMGYSRRAIYLKLRAHGIDPKSYRS